MNRLSRIKYVSLGLLLGLTLASGVAYAVNFNLVLTQAQVDIATWKWAQVDPTHTTYATAQLFGANYIVGDRITEFKNQRAEFRKSIVGSPTGYFCSNTWAGLNTTQQNAICTGVLGEVTGCTPCDANGN